LLSDIHRLVADGIRQRGSESGRAVARKDHHRADVKVKLARDPCAELIERTRCPRSAFHALYNWVELDKPPEHQRLATRERGSVRSQCNVLFLREHNDGLGDEPRIREGM